MRLELTARLLTLASWPTDEAAVASVIPPALDPAPVEGRYLVSAVAIDYEGGRLGRMRIPGFRQLNIRTYVSAAGEPAVFFLRAYVSALGLGGIAFGAPYRPARIRVDEGVVSAPGVGLSLRFAGGEAAEAGELGRHEIGVFEAAGLRCFRIERGAARWERASAVVADRQDAVLALGFDVQGPPEVFLGRAAAFTTDVPPRRLVSGREDRGSP